IAILGFTGKGPFNNVLTQSENSSVKYDRVTRKFSPSRLEIETSANTRILSLPKKILSFYTIQSILPPPKNVYEDKNTIIYSFSSTIPSVTFNLSSEKSGYINEFIKVGNEKLKIQQIILP